MEQQHLDHLNCSPGQEGQHVLPGHTLQGPRLPKSQVKDVKS